MKPIKAKRCGVLCAALSMALLTGCWDYRGLDQLSIVAGMALDQSPIYEKGFTISYEIIDASKAAQSDQSQTRLVESDGRSILEARYQTDKSQFSEVYLGNTELLAISEQLAKENGLRRMMEGFMRDATTRDTMLVVVARQGPAKQLITPQKGSGIMAFDVKKSLNQGKITSSPTNTMRVYQIYNALERNTGAIVLPAYSYRDVGEISIAESNGLAVFRGDKLDFYIEESQVPFYEYLTGEMKSGAYTYYFNDTGDNEPVVTMRILSSKKRLDYHFDQERLNVLFTVDVKANLYKMEAYVDEHSEDDINLLQERSGEALAMDINHLIKNVQDKTGLDVFNIGTAIYRRDPKKWEEISESWEEVFRAADIRCVVNVTLDNAGWVFNY